MDTGGHFSDESRSKMTTDDHRVKGERTKSANVVERHINITAAIVERETIGYDIRSPLVVIQGTVTA